MQEIKVQKMVPTCKKDTRDACRIEQVNFVSAKVIKAKVETVNGTSCKCEEGTRGRGGFSNPKTRAGSEATELTETVERVRMQAKWCKSGENRGTPESGTVEVV